MTALSIRDLNVQIRGTPVLRNVSLGARVGEVLAITGESGSGKSMTALAIMGLLPSGARATGTIALEGRSLLDMPEPALCAVRGREISMVFQEPMTALNPVQTIGAQVTESIRIHTRVSAASARDQATKVLTRVGLPPAQYAPSRYPHELSGGQRQRVVIAMAIALGPKVLLADEPTTALDVTTQARILDLLVGLARDDGMALVLVTHDLAVVGTRADQIAVMENGQVVEQGATSHVFATRKHPYTRKLFAAATQRITLPLAQTRAPLLVVQVLRRDYPVARRNLWGPRETVTAVKNVSFTLHKGERLGLVGESGCGKSTLTRAVLGLDTIQGGYVTLDGQPVARNAKTQRETRRKMQVVFQDPYGSFNPRHSVARLIAEPLHLLDQPPNRQDRETAVAEALAAVGLSADVADRNIHEFSGGQRQRIAIARALVVQPELVIFDEAVSALDVSVRAQILTLLAQLCQSHHLTYLFISHDLSVVRSVTDRVLVMQAGEIVEQGVTEDVFTKPQHSYTKRLIAAAPVLSEHIAMKGGPNDG